MHFASLSCSQCALCFVFDFMEYIIGGNMDRHINNNHILYYKMDV